MEKGAHGNHPNAMLLPNISISTERMHFHHQHYQQPAHSLCALRKMVIARGEREKCRQNILSLPPNLPPPLRKTGIILPFRIPLTNKKRGGGLRLRLELGSVAMSASMQSYRDIRYSNLKPALTTLV